MVDSQTLKVEEEIMKVEEQISSVDHDIKLCEENQVALALGNPRNFGLHGKFFHLIGSQLSEKEEQLRKEKEQLRKEKEQLREKELLLLGDSKLKQELDKFKDAAALAFDLMAGIFVYSCCNETQQPRDPKFKQRIAKEYGIEQNVCQLLQRCLPAVNAGHLFKHCWAHHAQHVMGIDNIDDWRNGLLLFRPIEWAFDSSRLCFYLDPEGRDEDSFAVKILDPNIKDVLLHQFATYYHNTTQKKVDGHQNWIQKERLDLGEVSLLTFGALENYSLRFFTKRPFHRVLCFQARQARRYAISKGWLQGPDWNFADFWSEGNYKHTIQEWIQKIQLPEGNDEGKLGEPAEAVEEFAEEPAYVAEEEQVAEYQFSADDGAKTVNDKHDEETKTRKPKSWLSKRQALKK